MKEGFRIFDTHSHLGVARHTGRRRSADQLLYQMDQEGIERTLVIPFPVVEDYRLAHDSIGKAVREHPDRLCGSACLDPFLPESEFRAEVRRCRLEYGLCALKFQPQFQGLNPISPNSEFLFESALENDLVLICHTGSGIPFALPSLFMPAARKFSDLALVLAHCGGGGIFSLEAIVAALFCSNVYLELSTLMPHQILEVLRQVPSRRLMIGSDLPENLQIEIGKILGLDVNSEDKENILWNTAATVFGRAQL